MKHGALTYLYLSNCLPTFLSYNLLAASLPPAGIASRLDELRMLRAECLLRPLFTRLVPLLRLFREAIVTMPRFEFRAIDMDRLARCDIAIGPFLLFRKLFLLCIEEVCSSSEGDLSSMNFFELPVGVTCVCKFFFDNDFFTWKANGECRW